MSFDFAFLLDPNSGMISNTLGKTAFDWDLYQNRRQALQAYRDSKEYMDGLLVASDETTFPVHIAVISGLGEFVTKYICKQINDSTSETIELDTASSSKIKLKKISFPQVSGPVLKTLVDVAYTGDLVTDSVSVWNVLEVAESFRMKEVESGCLTFVSHFVSGENCLEMYRLAKQKHHPKLLHSSLTAIKHNFRSVVEQSIFYTMIDVKDLNMILAADDLNTEREEYVWSAIKRWALMDENSRYVHIGKLLGNLRFMRTRADFLDQLYRDRSITDSRHHGSLISTVRRMITSKKKGGYTLDGWSLPIGVFPDIIKPRIPNSLILAIGGWKGGVTSNLIESFDRSTNMWFEVPAQKCGPTRAYHGVQYLKGKLYLIGGTDGRNVQDSVHCFDPVTYEWDELAPLRFKRCYVSTAVLDGKIYAMGGHNGDFRMRYCERYDPVTNEWTSIADMIIARSDANAVVVNKKIYICGGLNENMIERTAEVYNPENDQWSLLPEMSTPRSSLGVVALNGMIYVMGGNSGERRLRTVERFDPDSNTWFPVTSMYQQRSTFTATVLEGKIYVCGGYSGTSPFDGVERYNPETCTWTRLASMNYSRSGLSVIAIHDLLNASQYTYLGNVRAPNLRL